MRVRSFRRFASNSVMAVGTFCAVLASSEIVARHGTHGRRRGRHALNALNISHFVFFATGSSHRRMTEKYSPADVAIECDDYNGRWRVIAPTLEWRSISWTKRGYEKAALEVIHQAWVFQKDWNGQQSPFSLEELATRFSKPD